MNISKAEGSLKRLLHSTGNEETVAARVFHVPSLLEVRGFTHRHSWKAETWWIWSSATSSFLLTRCKVHRHLQRQKNPQAKFQFFRLFVSLSDLFLSPSLLVFSSAILYYYIPLRVYCGGCPVLWVVGGDIAVAAAIVDGEG
jgi:hypothetical protein